MSRIVGIDLGTTNSLVATLENGQPRIVPSPHGERLLPSVVSLSPAGEIFVGTPALNQYALHPERTIRSVKRLMGSDTPVRLGDREYRPEEISALILRELKAWAERYLGERVERAVITVPAYFSDRQRQATRDAGQIAGFEVERILNEPTAAAMAYSLGQPASQCFLVYDLGGGTFDVSIVEQEGEILEVRASHGNTHLGGDDFDKRLTDRIVRRYREAKNIDLSTDRVAMARLVRSAELAKIRLSDHPFARVTEEFLLRRGLRSYHLDEEVAREEFVSLIDDLLKSTLESVDFALREAHLMPDALNHMLLVGGSTRIPAVEELLHRHLGIEPRAAINPEEVVALGAAVQAGIIVGEPVEAILIDVAAHSLGIEIAEIALGDLATDRYKILIRRNTAIPTSKSDVFYTLTPEQDTARIHVYQGEHDIASQNTLLGEFTLTGIAPNPDPGANREVLVQFDYDLNGIVSVAATDRRSGHKEVICVQATGRGISDAEKAAARGRLEGAMSDLPAEALAILREADVLVARLSHTEETASADALRSLQQAVEDAYRRGDRTAADAELEKLLDLVYTHQAG
jgi:molecular chaperone DnaK